jgi:aspartate/methionine/tyrosine aminotransferase
VEDADKAHGGRIYLCNPNNPTSAVTVRKDLDWLVSNLPANTMLLVDEVIRASWRIPQWKERCPYVRQGKAVW